MKLKLLIKCLPIETIAINQILHCIELFCMQESILQKFVLQNYFACMKLFCRNMQIILQKLMQETILH